MGGVLKWGGRILGLLVLVAAIALALNWSRVERLSAVMSLFEPDRIVTNHSNMNQLFETAALPRGDGPMAALPMAPGSLPTSFEHGGESHDIADWMASHATTSIVVLHDGALIYEDYLQGTTAEDRRISWSVAKSFLSVLLGTVVEEGAIASLDDPVVQYVPELEGSAYQDATVRNVAQMASGVAFNEDYLDFNSDINRMGRVLALGFSMDDFAAGLTETVRPPGEAWAYVSIDTHVLGMVIRGATGRSATELMAERVIAPLGMESEPYYVTDGYGVAFVLGGLNMMTRDYARFGQMVLDGGVAPGGRIVSEAWIAESIAPSAPPRPARTARSGAPRYGFQWWIPDGARPGEVFAVGIYDQFVYIDRQSRVVVAMNSANRGFAEPGNLDGQIALFRAIRDHVADTDTAEN
ncbi:MAG: serine hydrolase [Pseudomonadota bacterium]